MVLSAGVTTSQLHCCKVNNNNNHHRRATSIPIWMLVNQFHPLKHGQIPSWPSRENSGTSRRGPGIVKASSKDEPERAPKEIRVCLNRACRKSGSGETLDIITSLAPPNVKVDSCGCLGHCGSGPNLLLLPEEIFISHCSTAAHAAHLLAIQCGASDPENNLIALALKEQGNKEFQGGNFVCAEQLFSQAIDLQPSGGLHILYANRSKVRLARGDNLGALADAKEASRIAPNWHVPHLRQGEAYIAKGEYEAAEHLYLSALSIEPSLRRSKSFKAQVQKIQENLALRAST